MKKVNIEYSILNTEVQECLGACKGLDCTLIALCAVMNGRRCRQQCDPHVKLVPYRSLTVSVTVSVTVIVTGSLNPMVSCI